MSQPSKSILVVGTLDTKGVEVGFVRDLIRARGHQPVVLDAGIRGAPQITPDIAREAVAEAAHTTLSKLLESGDKNAAIEAMANGAAAIAETLFRQGRLDGIIGLGGVQGTVIATRAMRALPIGVPKVMLSAVANGQTTFGPFVGAKDVAVMHSVADIMGLNAITRRVLTEAAGAIVGMCEMPAPAPQERRRTVGLTMAGVTTACAMAVHRLLEGQGVEVIGFHCNGVGAEAMESLAGTGQIDAILDLSPHDIGGYLRGGLMRCSPERLTTPAARGTPIVFVPGALDFILGGPVDQLPEALLRRRYVVHNPIHTHIRASYEEMLAAGRFVGERLATARGPVRVIIPTRGFSQLNVEGGPLFDPQADSGFQAGLEAALAAAGAARVDIVTTDMHINADEFAAYVASAVLEIAGGADG